MSFNVRRATGRAVPLLLCAALILLGEQQVARLAVGEYLRSRTNPTDVPARIERLVSQLDDVLPPAGYIGYIDPDHSWFNANATRQFYLTQYALAPRVLVYNTLPNYVIYFSHRGEPLSNEAIPADMRVLKQVRLDLAVLTRAQ
jgi:hypothetical protein